MLAESCRSKNFKVAILDTLAEQMKDENSLKRIQSLNPRLICFVVYGQNVNAGTTNMSGAIRLAKYLKTKDLKIPISFIGSHVQALPKKTLQEETSIDIAFLNEGVYALWNLLSLEEIKLENIKSINGISYR